MKSNLCEPAIATRRLGVAQHRRAVKLHSAHAQSYSGSRDGDDGDRLSAIIESADDAIISKTLDGIITSWNAGAAAMFGYEAAETIGQSMLRMVPIDRVEEEYRVLQRILAGEKVAHFETIRIRKNGLPIDISVTISAVLDGAGSIVGSSLIARDIAEKKHREIAFNQYHALIDFSDDAIITKTLEGCITSWNNAAQKIFGYTAAQIIGRPILDLFPQERYGEEKNILHKITCGGKIDHFETVLIHKDGTPVNVMVTISPLRDQDGSIVGACKIARDITQLRWQQQLKQLAHYDALTGLPNRLLLSERLHQAIAQERRTGSELALMHLELDGFKSINDEHGHDLGDALLIEIARRIGLLLGDNDTLARIDGYEFAIILAQTDCESQIREVIKRILQDCTEVINIDGKPLALSASIGLTTYPYDNVEEHQLLHHADLAMYEAMQSGKNRYAKFDASREAKSKGRYLHARRLGQAMEQNELLLHYQPKVNMRTHEVVGVEALIRWQHPEHGLLTPVQFLPLLEGHPLMEEIGIWVIGCALTQMERWQQEGMRMPVSVNLAPNQLQNPDFPGMLSALLARHSSVDPADLELEILETSALQDFEAVSQVMQTCRQFGVQFSIDDFGTGYSSLTYLKRLPATILKIDQSFVHDMLADQEDMAIVRGVIGLAAAFQRKVIAEGVETIAHGKKLLQLGCELAQGYGISRPMAAHVLPSWIETWHMQRPWAWT